MKARWQSTSLRRSGPTQPVRNAGIVGGRREFLEPALGAIASRVHAHYGTVPRPPPINCDMVFWNDLLLGQQVVTGYPFGAVNYPMWGRFAESSPWCRASAIRLAHSREGGAAAAHVAAGPCIGACRVAFVNGTLQGRSYWFSHKLQEWWSRFNVDHLIQYELNGRPDCEGSPGLALSDQEAPL